MPAPFSFTVPPELLAHEPPERRGLARHEVRLMVIERASGSVEHTSFDRLGDFLRAGDLLVFNSSRTLPASLAGCAKQGPCIEIRLAGHLPDDSWLALLLCKNGDPFSCGLRPGMQVEFGAGLKATVHERRRTDQPPVSLGPASQVRIYFRAMGLGLLPNGLCARARFCRDAISRTRVHVEIALRSATPRYRNRLHRTSHWAFLLHG